MVAGPPNWASLRLGDGVWVCWGLGSCCFLLHGLGAVVPPSCSSAAGLGAVHRELIYIWSDSESPHPWKPRRFSPWHPRLERCCPAPLAGLALRGVGQPPRQLFGVVQLAVGSGLGDGWGKEPHVCMGAPKITPSCAAYTVNQVAAVGMCTCGGTRVYTDVWGVRCHGEGSITVLVLWFHLITLVPWLGGGFVPSAQGGKALGSCSPELRDTGWVLSPCACPWAALQCLVIID